MDVRGIVNKMATTDTENISNGIDNIKIDEKEDSNQNSSPSEFESRWGLPVQDVYKIAVRFFKGKLVAFILLLPNKSNQNNLSFHLPSPSE